MQGGAYDYEIVSPPEGVLGIFQVAHRGQVVFKRHENRDVPFPKPNDLCFLCRKHEHKMRSLFATYNKKSRENIEEIPVDLLNEKQRLISERSQRINISPIMEETYYDNKSAVNSHH